MLCGIYLAFYKKNGPLITSGMTKNDTGQIRLSFRYTFDKNTSVRKESVKSNGNSTKLNRLNL